MLITEIPFVVSSVDQNAVSQDVRPSPCHHDYLKDARLSILGIEMDRGSYRLVCVCVGSALREASRVSMAAWLCERIVDAQIRFLCGDD